MKILVLHGDHTLDSYNRLREIIDKSKSKGWQIERISDKEPLGLPEKLTSSSLFGDKALFVVEAFGKLKSADLKWLKKNAKNIDAFLVIYSPNTVGNRELRQLPNGFKVEEYKLPKLIWKFLDSFCPGNARECIGLLHRSIEGEPEEFVFAVLARHLKDLYWVKVAINTIPYPSWRVGKLKRQSVKFADSKLRNIISFLAKADLRAKTSKANLIDDLDFLIATHLE